MENALLFTMILLFAELFEAYIQRAQTLLGVLAKLYAYYRKSIFWFFLIQPGFYFILFVVVLTGILNVTMIFLLAIKIFDLFYKIELIKKVFIERKVSPEIAQMLEWKIPSMFFLMGAFLYPPLLYYALT
ncbi:hypothetical protein MN086_08845 [Sulfurovum sp. XGS-02]|uniref:hypothetical protein n=1 Tax=Sulfurovum sp. XGS-02 TaxID=2925411 RepID=UPI0020690F13|nr:hypothetical protein [Sulfurovum sp. XGS-02]UPT77154.1 hypothetical protein MN086_08845 [Sulfurovum sp. XGS-02]